MRKFLFNTVFAVGLCLLLVSPWAFTDNDSAFMEELGMEEEGEYKPVGRQLDRDAPDMDVLLIPDSTADVVNMYDPFDGTLLGVLIDLSALPSGPSTPINAVLGPDGYIYVSDQVDDSVSRWNPDGTYVDTYADGSDGLNNIRGIDFYNGHLFVTSGDDYVAEFDAPHSRLPDFINDGSDPFDILFLPDGRALLADIQGSTDNVRLYNADGTLNMELFSVSFPEQVQIDTVLPGAYLNNSFSADLITDFDLDGTIDSQLFFNGGRGIYRLGNGNLLATAGDGVWELDPVTGDPLEQESGGSARFIELLPVGAEAVELYLDIKPGSCPNSFNPKSQGKLPVALLGTMDFDVMDIDPASVVISREDGVGGSVGITLRPNMTMMASYEDVATPFDGDLCDCHEMGPDGYMDLGFKFSRPELVAALELGSLEHNTLVELVVSGELLDGTPFEARDCIRIVGHSMAHQ